MFDIKELVAPSLPASLWAATSTEHGHYGQAPDRLDTRVLVIGAGFTGLSAALHLAERNVDVTLLDAGEPGFGASGRNGGQVIPGLKFDPDELVARFGPDMGERMTATVGRAAEDVFDLVRRYGIACDARHQGWIQPAHAPTTLPLIRRRAQQWERRGVPVTPLDADTVSNMIGCEPVYAGGWLDPRGGCLQPLSYARGMARAASSAGARVHAATRVSSLQRVGSEWLATHQHGHVRAESVILATNGYSDGLHEPLARSIVPAFSLQVATQPLPEPLRRLILPGGQAASDSRRLLWYYRLDAHGRLLMGGRGPDNDRPALAHGKSALAAIHTLFPALAEIPLEYVWAGRVAMTPDHLPHLHRLDHNLYAGLGFNGRGVAMGTVMGRLLAQLATGASERDVAFPVTPVRPIAFRRLSRLGVMGLTHYYRFRDKRETRRQAS